VAEALGRVELDINVEDDVVLVRRRVKALAQERGFDPFATAAVTTAASELARNVLVHGKGGRAVVEAIAEGGRRGLRLELRDEGPGIPDIDRALAGGFSTARSLGLGLSGSRRLVDEFHIESTVGAGTVVRVVKWARY
jgi:serine/threonine-protein kinase RsbT